MFGLFTVVMLKTIYVSKVDMSWALCACSQKKDSTSVLSVAVVETYPGSKHVFQIAGPPAPMSGSEAGVLVDKLYVFH